MKNNTINTNNYELFFVDYLEGNLSSADEALLLAFLDKNPHLKEEFNLFLNSKLEPASLEFNNKDALKKPHFSKNGISNEIDYLCIASVENDIASNEQENLNSLVKGNEDNRVTLSFFLKTKLEPNSKIEYAHKQSLKRYTVIGFSQRVVKIVSGVAAGLFLFIGSYSLVKYTQVEQNLQVAISSPLETPIQSKLPTNIEEIIHKTPTQNRNINASEPEKPKVESIIELNIVDSTKIRAINHIATNGSEMLIKPIELIELSASNVGSNQLALAEITNLGKSDIVSSAEILKRKGNTKEVGLFEIAQIGVSKLASYTDSNFSLNAKKNDNGRITRISFESTLFAISTPIRKK